VPELESDKAVVFEELFVAGLHMPSHTALAEILMKFKVQIHQLTPNAIVQLSKFFWAVSRFGGRPTTEVLAKRDELHYQQKKIEC
jgi:dimeric dUTPase (all-alpha-NTP-PPase superfamily)